MDFSIVIPAHNEEVTLKLTLESLIAQTLLPKQLVVVNDNSTDSTLQVAQEFANKYPWISVLDISTSQEHQPGSKVVNAFYKGFETLDSAYDIICKFDADLIFPPNYLEKVAALFKSDDAIGIAGGNLYIKKNDNWVYESISKQTHVRGPIKAYRKQCFEEIGGLKRSIGWDTVDTLLAQYHTWQMATETSLKVKHLKPTGTQYQKTSKYKQGEAMYKMRYGITITSIAALKLALKKKSPNLLKDYLIGYFKAKQNGMEYLVSKKEGDFIRALRWKGILGK
ncbi:glycosyltransferase family 2 protein [Mangrovimonas sp. TPBH4]|uniref:glycosyltransferase family 2 protein n=1 Tax=Mangrovimonas sp. TPBH4 TaxID=1645914 RepID=UPI0006B6878C|nr:glycosyltransferase family 2 protein [Mangrovimonas sp. TPBH4]